MQRAVYILVKMEIDCWRERLLDTYEDKQKKDSQDDPAYTNINPSNQLPDLISLHKPRPHQPTARPNQLTPNPTPPTNCPT